MQPVPTAPTAAEDGGLSTHVLHMTRLHAKRPLLVELRVINGPFEGGCRLQSGAGAWLACNTSPIGCPVALTWPVHTFQVRAGDYGVVRDGAWLYQYVLIESVSMAPFLSSPASALAVVF